MFGNLAKSEQSLLKAIGEKTADKGFLYKTFRDEMIIFETKIAEFELKIGKQPENSTVIYSAVSRLRENLKHLTANSKTFDGLVNMVTNVNLDVECSNEQLEALLGFKTNNYSDILRRKLSDNSDANSSTINEQTTNDLFKVLDAVVNDDTNDKINHHSSRHSNFGSSPIKTKTQSSAFRLENLDNQGHQANPKPKFLNKTPSSKTLIGRKTVSNMPNTENFNQKVEELDLGNLRSIYDYQSGENQYEMISQQFSERVNVMKNDSSSQQRNTEERNIYSKNGGKMFTSHVFSTNYVNGHRGSLTGVGSGSENKKNVLKTNFVVISGKTGVVSNQVIDEIKLKDIMVALRGYGSIIKQIDFIDNSFKCNIVSTFKQICQESLPFALRLDMKKNKHYVSQNIAKKDKNDLALLNIHISM